MIGQYRQALGVWVGRFTEAQNTIRQLEQTLVQLTTAMHMIIDVLDDDQVRELLKRVHDDEAAGARELASPPALLPGLLGERTVPRPEFERGAGDLGGDRVRPDDPAG